MAEPSMRGGTGSRRAIAVLGMHRSGTSALTRVLSLCGAALPQTPLVIPGQDVNDANSRVGFWESEVFREIHDGILTDMGSSWSDPGSVPQSWFSSDACEVWEDRLYEGFMTEYGDAPTVVVKDPRMCRLLPMWLRVFERSNVDPIFVVVIRNPLEVIASLRRRNGFLHQHGLALWLQYVLASERHTRGLARSFVSYDDLLDDWRGVVATVSHQTGLDLPSSFPTAESEIEQFLDRDLRHQERSVEELVAAEDISEWVKQVYSWTLGAKENPNCDPDPLDTIHDLISEAEKLYGPLLAARRAESRPLGTVVTYNVEPDVGVKLSSEGFNESEFGRKTHNGVTELALRLSEQTQRITQLEYRLEEREKAAVRFGRMVSGLAKEESSRTNTLETFEEGFDHFGTELTSISNEVDVRINENTDRLEKSIESTRRLANRNRTATDRQFESLSKRMSESFAIVNSELEEVARDFSNALEGHGKSIDSLRQDLAASQRRLEQRISGVDSALARHETRIAQVDEADRAGHEYWETTARKVESAVQEVRRGLGSVEGRQQFVESEYRDFRRRVSNLFVVTSSAGAANDLHRRFSVFSLVIRSPKWLLNRTFREQYRCWRDARKIARSGLFLPTYYLAGGPDVFAEKIDALGDFTSFRRRRNMLWLRFSRGWFCGRFAGLRRRYFSAAVGCYVNKA